MTKQSLLTRKASLADGATRDGNLDGLADFRALRRSINHLAAVREARRLALGRFRRLAGEYLAGRRRDQLIGLYWYNAARDDSLRIRARADGLRAARAGHALRYLLNGSRNASLLIDERAALATHASRAQASRGHVIDDGRDRYADHRYLALEDRRGCGH